MNGLLLIDKPQGMTSHDVVARVRRIIGMRAIGHAGTLDPFATGLLILCIGHATRLSEYLIGETKTYTGRMRLGERTNTDDVDGEVVDRRPVHAGQADLERARALFTGDIMQVPPQYSAIQIGGRRAYKMARQGEVVALPARPVHIDELDLQWAQDEGRSTVDERRSSAVEAVEVDMRVVCSSGTYIRALARDIGEVLGCGAHLTRLRRVQSGPFTLSEAITLDALQQAANSGNWQGCALPMDRAVDHFPQARLDQSAAQRLLMGQPVKISCDGPANRLFRVYDAIGQFVAIGEYDSATSMLRPLKVFHARE